MLHDATPHEALRVLRDRRRLTLRQTANLIGCGHPHLSNIENGKAHPGLEVAVAIEREFGIPVASWVARDEHEDAA